MVAKEKDPPLLMEFGPSGHRARGVTSELLLSSAGTFPEPDAEHATFELLTVWRMQGNAADAIHDISDVAVGPDSRMYLLSDESRSIARLESHLRPEASGVAAVEVWLLPQTIVQPEGLVIQEDMVPLVAIDRQDTGENLFRLQSLSV